jgi:hypothetical protein
MYDFYPVDDEYYRGTGSVNDCTGLIPAGLTEEEELEYYGELYPYLPKNAEDYID